jgi:hypothetical protein
MLPAPKIDQRRAADLARDVRKLLPLYVPEWPGGNTDALSNALINIFARFGEMIIDRLNQAPDKNLLAFLDLMGISQLPSQPSRVPLTFYLTPNARGAFVPRGTQVAAEPAPGERQPVTFETERDAMVSAVELEALMLKDGGHDRYTDFGCVIKSAQTKEAGVSPADTSALLISGETKPIPHALYVSVRTYPVWPARNRVNLRFTVEEFPQSSPDRGGLRWQICAASPPSPNGVAAKPETGSATIKFVEMTPVKDDTQSLSRSGDIVFQDLPEIPDLTVNGLSGQWLRCQLSTPITPAGQPASGMAQETHLPSVKALSVNISLDRSDLSVQQAFVNNTKLDTTKDFFPFTEKPKFGDTLYLANAEAFSNPDASIRVHVTLTNPASGVFEAPIPPVAVKGTKLQWEFWDGETWADLGIAEPGGKHIRVLTDTQPDSQLSDTTEVFSQSGDVQFRFTKPPKTLTINGQNNYWIRVRIVAGNYGNDVRYEKDAKGAFVPVPETFAPPSIQAITIAYTVDKNSPPAPILTYNNFSFVDVSGSAPFKPFSPVPAEEFLPSLHFGFALPKSASPQPPVGGKTLPNQDSTGMSLYLGSLGSTGKQQTVASSGRSPSPAIWEYWNGERWTKLTVRDETQGARHSGLIRFVVPADFALSKQFERGAYWLRMRQADSDFNPELTIAAVNTIMATQGAAVSNDLLGTSNGEERQVFRTTRAPILEGQQLEVRESMPPPMGEQLQIKANEGENAIRRAVERGTGTEETWVRWHAVPDFYASGPRDRHYVLNRTTGEVIFGNGQNGIIPPPLPANIVMASYRTGGGTSGNKPALGIKQLKSAVPYIARVANWEAADGGSDAETIPQLLDRGTREPRHQMRAVTVEDFEDLAMLAAREVARAKCVPLYDLLCDPESKQRKPGVASLIIVPRSLDPQPYPSDQLLACIRHAVENQNSPTMQLVLLGPEYLAIDVYAEVTVDDPETASQVEHSIADALDRYLHPIAGGANGSGWDFGREPQRSELYALVGGVQGVNHVRELRAKTDVTRTGADKTGHFLICCGKRTIVTTLEE